MAKKSKKIVREGFVLEKSVYNGAPTLLFTSEDEGSNWKWFFGGARKAKCASVFADEIAELGEEYEEAEEKPAKKAKKKVSKKKDDDDED